MMKTTHRTLATVLAATALLAATTGCKSEKKEKQADMQKVNLQVSAVHLQDSSTPIVIQGRVEPNPEHVVRIYSPLSGRLLGLNVQLGQDVHRGQTVATVQSGDVAAARSDFEKAKIEVIRADRALDRAKLMLAHEVISQADFYEAKATDDAAHSEQERARARVHELGFSESGNSDIAPIASPIAGSVIDVGTATGEMQRSLDNANAIATIANLDTIWITGDIFEHDLANIHVGTPVDITVNAYPGETFHGTIANIGNAFDPSTHTLKARVVMQNPGHKLKPAMFAQMMVRQPSHTAIVLPAAAVLHDGETPTVYVEVSKDNYQPRAVKLGGEHDGKVEVVSGLNEGDRVVVEGAAYLRQPVGD